MRSMAGWLAAVGGAPSAQARQAPAAPPGPVLRSARHLPAPDRGSRAGEDGRGARAQGTESEVGEGGAWRQVSLSHEKARVNAIAAEKPTEFPGSAARDALYLEKKK
jgi:hypothetical protein